jgi:hypothetical protein
MRHWEKSDVFLFFSLKPVFYIKKDRVTIQEKETSAPVGTTPSRVFFSLT